MGQNQIKPKKLTPSFPYALFLTRFLLFFSFSLLVLLVITPWLSLAKLFLVRSFLSLILGSKAPYIHPLPYFKSMSISLAVFFGLFLSYQKISPLQSHEKKKDIRKALIALFLLWLIEVGSHVLEITVTKLGIHSFVPNFLLTLLLSIGPIGFPLLFWMLFFRPSLLD